MLPSWPYLSSNPVAALRVQYLRCGNPLKHGPVSLASMFSSSLHPPPLQGCFNSRAVSLWNRPFLHWPPLCIIAALSPTNSLGLLQAPNQPKAQSCPIRSGVSGRAELQSEPPR
jgi:hypothetical protein